MDKRIRFQLVVHIHSLYMHKSTDVLVLLDSLVLEQLDFRRQSQSIRCNVRKAIRMSALSEICIISPGLCTFDKKGRTSKQIHCTTEVSSNLLLIMLTNLASIAAGATQSSIQS